MIGGPADCYTLYGFNVKTSFPFRYCERVNRRPQIEIVEKAPSFFAKVTGKFSPPLKYPEVYYHQFPDLSEYLRLFDSFHFWISPRGTRIAYQTLTQNGKRSRPGAIRSSLVSCLQSNVMSFAITKRGIEPVHASAVVVEDKAIAFLGDSGLGKSTLTASFVREGFPVLTDDILAVRKAKGNFWAAAGTPCIKLFPKTARRIFKAEKNEGPMYPAPSKSVFPLRGNRMFQKGHVPLAAFYLLQAQPKGRKTIRLERLKKQKASIELVRSTYNCLNQSSERLKKQLLFIAELTEKIPMFSLTYPRDYDCLPQVRETILRSHSLQP